MDSSSVTPFPVQDSSALDLRAEIARIDARLSELVPAADAWPIRLHRAERHALLAPGKRFRPLLCLKIAAGYGTEGAAAMDTACVSEMVHAASLILDDLPCMDDADLRRNQPTTHVAFDESTAILTATALLNRAFGVLMRLSVDPAIRVELGEMLSFAVGSKGLIAGQMADLSNDDLNASVQEVERLNSLKTGALFDFSIDAGAVLAQVGPRRRSALRDFSQQLGLAFQLLDDIKDQILSDQEAEKSTGRDVNKATLIALSGMESAKARLSSYLVAAKDALQRADLSNTDELAGLLDHYFAFLDG